MKMDARQEAVLSRVKATSERLRVAKANVEARVREMVRDELAELTALRDAETREAWRVGVSKAAIKRALGTKDHATLQNILAGVDFGVDVVSNQITDFDSAAGTFTLNFVDTPFGVVNGSLPCVFAVNDFEVAGSRVSFEWLPSYSGDPVAVALTELVKAGDTGVYRSVCEMLGSKIVEG
jgi:hypothetical protein